MPRTRPPRFLIVAPSFHDWDLGRYLELLLPARGIDCHRFAYRAFASDAEANEALRATAERARPDVVLGLKMGRIASDTLAELRRRGAFVVLWYVDCFSHEIPAVIARHFNAVDLFLTTAKGMLPAYRALGATPAEWLYEGVYLPAFPDVVVAPALAALYRSDIAFVGNVFHPPVGDRRLALRRFRLLRKLCARHQLKIWGLQGAPDAARRWGRARCPMIQWPAHHDELVRICRSAAVVLGINTVNDVELYFSNRVFLVLASGGFHLTHYVPGLETMFRNHEHLVWYESDAECLQLAGHYLRRPAARRRIAAQGRAWTRRRYGMQRQVGRLLALVAAEVRLS